MATLTIDNLVDNPIATLPKISNDHEEFRFGHRMIEVIGANGKVDYQYIPIKQEYFLDPQEGDYFVQGSRHEDDVDDVKGIFRHIHRRHQHFTVYSDLKMVWGIPNLSEPAPDVSVIPDVIEPRRPRGKFVVPEEGTRPLFVLEMVSPNYVEPDLNSKVGVYEQAGVEEYIIIDSGLRPWNEENIFYRITGYRLQNGHYIPIQPDERGWIYSEVNQVWLGTTAAGDEFFIVDAHTGEFILPDWQQTEIAEERALEAQLRAEQAESLAEQERVRAEQAESRIAQEQDLAEQAKILAEKYAAKLRALGIEPDI